MLEQWNTAKSIKADKSADSTKPVSVLQQEIAERIREKNPTRHTFVKPKPMIGYRITSDRPEDIPRVIWDRMGETDKAKYTQEYLSKHIGDVVALQLKTNGSPDFYVAGGFSKKYREISLEEVKSADATLLPSLFEIEGLEDIITDGSNIVGASRMYPTEMIKMSDLGYSIDEEVTIYRTKAEQWQTKLAGRDAYLAFNSEHGEYYMVNIDEQTGMPIGYSLAEEEKGKTETTSPQQVEQKETKIDISTAKMSRDEFVSYLMGLARRLKNGEEKAVEEELKALQKRCKFEEFSISESEGRIGLTIWTDGASIGYRSEDTVYISENGLTFQLYQIVPNGWGDGLDVETHEYDFYDSNGK